MKVPKGQTLYVGAKKFKAGAEIPEAVEKSLSKKLVDKLKGSSGETSKASPKKAGGGGPAKP